MPVLHYSRLSVPHPSSSNVPSTLLWPCTMKEYKYCLQNTFQASFYDPVLKKVSPSSMYLNSSRLYHIGALHMSVDIGNISNFRHFHGSKVCIDSSEMATCDEEARVDVFSEYIDGFWDMDQTEKERRRKIGLANKGRVPWNKGRKHSAETRARIKQRTREALRNPKVRKKMGVHPIAHSDESKARISSALKHVWGKRLRWKQLGEKFLLTWSESIAKAAKDGGNDQQELDWDSYDKIKQEMALQRLQWAVDRAKAKEMAKKQAALVRAEKAALKKAEKIAKLAVKKKEREEKAKARREIKRKASRKSEKKGVSPGLKLMKRLIKIHKKKSVAGPVIPENTGDLHIRAWEKLDIDLVKKEKMQSEISLADQIQAAKEKRMESVTREVLQPHSLVIHQADWSWNRKEQQTEICNASSLLNNMIQLWLLATNDTRELVVLEMGIFISTAHFVGREEAACSLIIEYLAAAAMTQSRAARISAVVGVIILRFLTPSQHKAEGLHPTVK